MKTPRKENRNLGLPAFTGTMRTDPNTSSLITWGWKQEKLQPQEKWEKAFLLTSPSIERFFFTASMGILQDQVRMSGLSWLMESGFSPICWTEHVLTTTTTSSKSILLTP